MSWKRKKVYQCFLCKVEKPEVIKVYPEGKMDFVPQGWEGDVSKRGIILCDKCVSKLRRLSVR